LKSCMSEQKCKINVTGRKRGDSRVRIAPTSLQWRVIVGVDDYALKCRNKKGRTM
jgi:hypothetical protein